MPIYEYRCTNCQRELESIQKITDAPLKTCPSCGKDALSRLISRSSFQLKGGGWYDSGYSKETAPAKPAQAQPTQTAEKPAEAKPATATSTEKAVKTSSSSSSSSTSGEA
jgi:putative FmdB family regulatory protein